MKSLVLVVTRNTSWTSTGQWGPVFLDSFWWTSWVRNVRWDVKALGSVDYTWVLSCCTLQVGRHPQFIHGQNDGTLLAVPQPEELLRLRIWPRLAAYLAWARFSLRAASGSVDPDGGVGVHGERGTTEGEDPRKFKILRWSCLSPNLTDLETFLTYDSDVMEGEGWSGGGGCLLLLWCEEECRFVLTDCHSSLGHVGVTKH
jgi:hypothetical protein